MSESNLNLSKKLINQAVRRIWVKLNNKVSNRLIDQLRD